MTLIQTVIGYWVAIMIIMILHLCSGMKQELVSLEVNNELRFIAA